MMPLLNELGQKYVGRAKVAKLKMYDNQEIVTKYEIKKTPTLLFLNMGNWFTEWRVKQQKKSLKKISKL
jgi:thiol-disulfide isomerase/thioredoxin